MEVHPNRQIGCLDPKTKCIFLMPKIKHNTHNMGICSKLADNSAADYRKQTIMTKLKNTNYVTILLSLRYNFAKWYETNLKISISKSDKNRILLKISGNDLADLLSLQLCLFF